MSGVLTALQSARHSSGAVTSDGRRRMLYATVGEVAA